jgi:hypothetical protein
VHRRATAIALPSLVTATGRRDGIPVALMEAMALGRPWWRAQCLGIPSSSSTSASGLLVPPGDAVALADALAAWRPTPRCAADSAPRRGARVAEAFDVDRSAERLCALFAAQARRPRRFRRSRRRRSRGVAMNELCAALFWGSVALVAMRRSVGRSCSRCARSSRARAARVGLHCRASAT